MPGNPREMITSAERRFPVRIKIGLPPNGLVVVGDLVGEGSAQEQAVTGETPQPGGAPAGSCGTRTDRPRRRHPPPDRRPVPAHRSRLKFSLSKDACR